MDSELQPCPVCGQSGVIQPDPRSTETFLSCANPMCDMYGAYTVSAWNRLSQAARLLAATEEIDTAMQGDGANILDKWMLNTHVRARVGGTPDGPLADALTKIAEEIAQ